MSRPVAAATFTGGVGYASSYRAFRSARLDKRQLHDSELTSDQSAASLKDGNINCPARLEEGKTRLG